MPQNMGQNMAARETTFDPFKFSGRTYWNRGSIYGATGLGVPFNKVITT